MLLQTDSPLTARGGPFSPHAAAVGSAPTHVSAFSSGCDTKRSTHAALARCNHLALALLISYCKTQQYSSRMPVISTAL